MSYTSAPRPSQTRTRGRGARGGTRGGATRGRARGRGATGQMPPETFETENLDQDASDRTERRDGYTMITPNEKKREKIAQQAQKEEENYRKFKESRTQKSLSYVGTVGGGLLESSPRGMATGRGGRLPTTPSGAFGAKTSYKQSVRQKEEEEIAQKKDDARRKAEQNVSRESDRQRKLDEDRRMKNEAFLARLDKKKRPVVAVKAPTQDEELGAAASSNTSNFNGSLSQLTQKFPYLDPETLEEMLTSVDGDVEQAITLLSEDI